MNPTVILAAAERLAGIVNKTPVMTSRTLNDRVGCEVFLKCENFQRVGAFKFRGAYNAISQLSDAEKEAGVITHSSGNHAQGVALAAKLLGIKAVIVMPEDAPAIKRNATAAYGATIIPCPAIERENVTAELIAQHGYTLIHPYDNDAIIAGQGTAAYELFNEVGPLDTLFVPVGGGGLISGSGLATAVASPQCRVVGVEPEIAADANRSWRDGQIYTLDHVPATIADGLRTRFIGQRNLAIMRQYVHDMTAVSETAIWETLQFLWNRLKIIVEPSSAVALAPLFTGQYTHVGQRVGIILSGGNVDVAAVSGQWTVPSGQWTVGSDQPPATSNQPPATSNQQPATSNQPPAPSPQSRILVCAPLAEEAVAILQEVGEVDLHPDWEKGQILAQVGDYEAIIVGTGTRLDTRTISAGLNLRAIGNLNSRLDNIDVTNARTMGIEVCYAPDANAVAIAEHTLGRLIMAANRFGDGRLAGKTLGIIGFGAIGREVARRAQAFDMEILVNQPRLTPELALSAGVTATDFVDLLAEADFVSLHIPFKAETNAIIGAEELYRMKPTACLINTGHTDLVDDAALLDALRDGHLSGAALAMVPPQATAVPELADAVRQHDRVMVSPHVTTILGERQKETAVAVARKVADVLRATQAGQTLALELVPTDQVIPHEQIDEKRVSRLMERLEADGRLANPPITTYWKGKYIVLDGATRSTAFKRLGYPHLVVQVVPPEQKEFQLHTWYHAISSPQSFADLHAHLAAIDDLILTPTPAHTAQNAVREQDALCYLLDREGQATLVVARPEADRLAAMNALVDAYTKWGDVERTLLTDLPRLLAQFPQMTAVAIFPQFKPETVFEVASRGELLPAGLTRFIIPGRILRLNADLARLKQDEPLASKRLWFNKFLEEKLARSRMRYYQEPVILLDE